MPEPLKRIWERRVTLDPKHVHRGLDRRRLPLDSVEGRLQQAQRIMEKRDTVIADYIERKLAKVEEYYKSHGKVFTDEERFEWKERLLNAIPKAHEVVLAKARDIALRDPDTSLFLEKGFRPRVESFLNEQPHGTYFFIDANNLKKINDFRKKHEDGDLYLKILANSMADIARKYHLIIARVGGDEFSMYLASSSPISRERYTEIIEELRLRFKQNWYRFNRRIPFPAEIAVGVAQKSEFRTQDPTILYSKLRVAADKRMYEDKIAMKATRI